MCAFVVKFVIMAKNDEKKQIAYQLFVSTTFTRKQIAEHVRVTEMTLRGWITKGDWETIKNSRVITKPELLKAAYAQLDALQKDIAEKHNNVPPKAVSDALSSVIKQIDLLSDQPVYQYIEVLEDFTSWMSKNHPAELKAIAPILNEYTQHIAR